MRLLRMQAMKRSLLATSLVTLVLLVSGDAALAAGGNADMSEMSWPNPTRECRPWTRWWWLGSAVDKENLTDLLEQYAKAGLGGVEICPIYGAKGYESRYIDFLSPKWMDMLAHTTAEAKRLGLAVDLTTGTGWPNGGPNVSAEDASSSAILKKFDAPGGSTFKASLPAGKLQCLIAVSDEGKRVDLTAHAGGGTIEWPAPEGHWRVYALIQKQPIQKVKRAAPGGEGNVLDPYSVHALDDYLSRFDQAFASYHGEMPHSYFHDSFEYYGASWTNDFLQQFAQRRGYDLTTQLPALFGDGPEETVSRVKCDYRETISDLHLAYIQRWTQWAHSHGSSTRNQAHGAPGNLLDLYAAADIPETEIFKDPDESLIPMIKFSSSAAHLTGKKLASSESFTWLGEHFQVSLADVKPAADLLLLSGVNHIFFHGIPYSPKDVPWPGWLFYAAVNFGPEGGLWHDLPAFNAYVTRCQSVLQSGRPSNDVLLYFPGYDSWQKPGGLMEQFAMPGTWMHGTPFYDAAMKLWQRGYGFDQISDRMLAGATCENGNVVSGGNIYKAIVIPKCRIMPMETLKKMNDLARAGAKVIVEDSLPADVPGFADLDHRHAQFEELKKNSPLSVGADVDALLQAAHVDRETMTDAGLRFVRRAQPDGYSYFIANRGDHAIDGWVPLATSAQSAVLMDPRFKNRIGVGATRQSKNNTSEVYLQLEPGESCIVRTFRDRSVTGVKWEYSSPADSAPITLHGTWRVHFTEGGPALPADFQTNELASWTTLGDAEAKPFAGSAEYTLDFDAPPSGAGDWLLDLGRVCESARVSINGSPAEVLWCQPFQLHVGSLLHPGKNTLKVEVTNLAANRIADLDRRGVKWKSFHEINFVNRDYKPFDASHWPLRDSGLLGPVKLIPLNVKDVH